MCSIMEHCHKMHVANSTTKCNIAFLPYAYVIFPIKYVKYAYVFRKVTYGRILLDFIISVQTCVICKVIFPML